MKSIIKIFSFSASLFIASLLIICLTAKSPLEAKYDQTLQCVMQQGQFSTEAHALESNPNLRKVKNQILSIKKYKASCSDYGRGKPSNDLQMPPQKIIKDMNQARNLEKEVLQTLNKINEAHSISTKP